MPMLDTDRELQTLLRQARTVAVVGLSDRPDRDSHRIARYLLQAGYTIIPVNPGITTVLGLKAFPNLKSIGKPVDIVDVFRRPQFVPDVVDDAIASGAKALWLQYGVVHDQAAERASVAGLQVVMDRCIMVEHRRLIH